MKPTNEIAETHDEVLERLISRKLDNELTADETAELEQRLASDPAAARLYEELAWVDTQVGETLRREMQAEPTMLQSPGSAWWRTWGVAAAACIAALLWYGERPEVPVPEENVAGPVQAGILAGDSIWADAEIDGLTPVDPEVFDRLRAGVRDVERNWVIIPSDEPGEYLLIEVSRVRTEAYALHADL